MRDHRFHLLDIGDDGVAGTIVGHAQFGLEAQAGQRRAQIVRDAGQHFGALLFVAFEVGGHGVEGVCQFAQFLGAFFGQRRRLLPLANECRRACHRLQRLADAGRDIAGDEECQRNRQRPPGQPMAGEIARRPLARQNQPVFVFVMVVEAETDPEAGYAIDGGGNPRVFAETGCQFTP